jgi:hypothetical protein
MLTWLSTKLKPEGASGHPLGSEEGMQDMLSELHPGRSERNMHEFAEWLAEPAQFSAQMSPERTVRNIRRLDEASQAALVVNNRGHGFSSQNQRTQRKPWSVPYYSPDE